jgi:hypothetical protein
VRYTPVIFAGALATAALLLVIGWRWFDVGPLWLDDPIGADHE